MTLQIMDKKVKKYNREPVYGAVAFTKPCCSGGWKTKLHSKQKHSRCAVTYAELSELRSNLKARTQDTYRLYCNSLENSIRRNPRHFWQYFQKCRGFSLNPISRSKGGFEPSVSYNGETCSGVAAAEAFAEYFASVFLPDPPKLDPENRNPSGEVNNIPLPQLPPRMQ